jgi:acyl carrier protein
MDDEKLRVLFAHVLGVQPDVLNDESSPDTIPGWDSVKSMDLVLAIEEEFGIRLTDEQIESMLSYGLVKLAVAEALAG